MSNKEHYLSPIKKRTADAKILDGIIRKMVEENGSIEFDFGGGVCISISGEFKSLRFKPYMIEYDLSAPAKQILTYIANPRKVKRKTSQEAPLNWVKIDGNKS